MIKHSLLARLGLAGLIACASTAALAETRPAYVPYKSAKPAASAQAGKAAPPAMAAAPNAPAELKPGQAAAPKPAEQVKALSGVVRSRDGQTKSYGVSPKLRGILLKREKSAIAPQATKIGKFEQIKETAVYPHSTIGLLGNGCTGVLIGKRFVLTAGFCIYDFNSKKWYDNLDFWPALNGQTAPFGSVKWKNAWVAQGYVDTGDAAYEYGLIELDSDIGDTVGWFGFGFDNSFPHKNLAMTAYPGAVEELTMWQAICSLKKAQPGYLSYTCPITKQMEGGWGAPIWVQGKAADSWTVYGIYMGWDGKGYWANRITQPIYETLVAWMQPQEEQPPVGDAEEEGEEEEEGG